MEVQPNYEGLTSTIRKLYDIVHGLEESFRDEGRHFTLDGHLVGSIGEVYAAKRYGLKLYPAAWKAHDGEAPDGRLVQVKATQRNRVAISERPDYLIVLRIVEDGEIEEVYNGPGGPVWNLFSNRKRPKNGQYQVSLSRLKALDAEVGPEGRIPPLDGCRL